MSKHEEQEAIKKQVSKTKKKITEGTATVGETVDTLIGLLEIERRAADGTATPREVAIYEEWTTTLNAAIQALYEKNVQIYEGMAADLEKIEAFKTDHPDVLGEWLKENPAMPDEELLQRIAEYESTAPIQALQILKATPPGNYTFAKDIISESLGKGIINAGPVSMDVSKGHKGKCFVRCDITLDPNKYAVDAHFSDLDLWARKGRDTLIAAGIYVFTAEMVARAANGQTNGEKVSNKTVKAVWNSLMKQRDVDVRIDALEQYRYYKVISKDSDIQVYDTGKDFNAKIKTVIVSGQKKEAFVVQPDETGNYKQILFQHAEKLGQIVNIPANVLTIKKVNWTGQQRIKENATIGGNLRISERLSNTRDYLIRRIDTMRNTKSQKETSRVIKLETLYRETGTPTNKSKYTAKERERVFQCLDYWIAIGYIGGYEIEGTKPIKSIKITI